MRYSITGLILVLFIFSAVHLDSCHIYIEAHKSMIPKKCHIVKSDDCDGEDLDHPIPVINGPPDIEYVEGETNNTIVWYVENCSGQFYEIKRSNQSNSNQNRVLVMEDHLSHGNTTVIMSVDGLVAGIYDFYLYIWGIYYTCIWSDIVTVTVITANSSTTSILSNEGISRIVLVGFGCVFIMVLSILIVVSRRT